METSVVGHRRMGLGLTKSEPRTGASALPRERVLVYMALLVGLTLAVYGQVVTFDFVNFDDNAYVTENAHMRGPLSVDKVRWALTSGYYNNWHPLTWLSHMLDCRFFGLDPRWHHAVNLLFHVANVLLVFRLFSRTTGATGAAAFIAALFAVHPLHVETVAWISDRKDLLATFFVLLALLAYGRYARRPSVGQYVAVMAAFAFAVMAKSMQVTLPVILLLFDFWPLKRFHTEDGVIPSVRAIRLLLEKIPLFLIAGAASFAALTLRTEQSLSSEYRVSTTVISYVRYLFKFFWPVDLAVTYPVAREPFATWQVAGAAAVLILITAVVVILRRRAPYLLTGWAWYLITLLPVSGIVQIGGHLFADRYTYWPLVGLYTFMVFPLRHVISRAQVPRRLVTAAAVVLIVVLAVPTWAQTRHWRDSLSLMDHCIGATGGNALMYNNLGLAFFAQARYAEAAERYRTSIQIDPAYAKARYNLGIVQCSMGQYDEALGEFAHVIEMAPHAPQGRFGMAIAYACKGDYERAFQYFGSARAMMPADAAKPNSLADLLDACGRSAEAERLRQSR